MVKRGWQFDIIQRAIKLFVRDFGFLGCCTCYSFFSSARPTVKDMPQDVDDEIGDMKRMICWHDVQNQQGNTKKHMLPKDTFCTSDIFCMVFPSLLVALYSTYVWYLFGCFSGQPPCLVFFPRSSSLAPSSWVQGSCCVELLWWKWEKWIRWRTSKIRSSVNWWLDHPRTRIFDHGYKNHGDVVIFSPLSGSGYGTPSKWPFMVCKWELLT